MDREKETLEIEFEFVERFPELSLFYRLSSPLDSEMICIFPYFCPCEKSAIEIIPEWDYYNGYEYSWRAYEYTK